MISLKPLKTLALIALPLLSAISLQAKAYEGTPEQQVSAFFADYANGDAEMAVEKYFADSPTALSKEELTLSIAFMQQSLLNMNESIGQFLTTEDIYTEQITPSTVRIVKMAKHELSPMVIEFYFYKAKDTWHANRVMFDTSFSLLQKKL